MKKIVCYLDSIESQENDDALSGVNNNNLNGALDKILLSDKTLDMKSIQNLIAPIIRDCDVFISYSHDDSKIASCVAKELMKYGYNVFIDSLFWDSVDKALVKYNSKNCLNSQGKLDYKKIRLSSSTFNMILADSLIDTIQNSKIFIFVESEKNITKTISPWLYLENKIANEYENEIWNKQMNESLQFSKKKIEFPIDTSDFFPTNSLEKLLFILSKK